MLFVNVDIDAVRWSGFEEDDRSVDITCEGGGRETCCFVDGDA